MGETKKSEQNLGFIRREERKLMVFGLGTTDVCFEQGNCDYGVPLKEVQESTS